MSVKKSKTIKNLEIKANGNNISAKFQLYQHYNSGLYVEKDERLANKYLDEVIGASKEFNFRFDELKLFNYKRFNRLSLKMSDTNVTVIIGNNGAGKTSLLEAIKKSLSWFVNNFIREDTTGQKLVPNDISESNGSLFCTIESTIKLSAQNQFTVELSRPKEGHDLGLQGDYANIKLVADMYRSLNSRIKNFNLPILAYYPVERTQNPTQIQPNKIEKVSSENWNSLDGYDGALSSHQNFNRFLGWYKRLSNIDLSTNEEFNSVKSKINSNKDFISMLEEQLQKEIGSEDALKTMINKLSKEVSELEFELKKIKKPERKQIEDINNSIMTFMPEIKNIRYENAPLDGFFIEKESVKLEAKQLSQGERTLMALVGDIARRLILLNPSLPNPLRGSGIVLIDEIDLHIHPLWQQKVVQNLTKTFPNIQFILTTHSPQVLSTVSKNEIRVIGSNLDGHLIAVSPLAETYAHPNSDVMESVMGVKAIPLVKEFDLIQQYRMVVEQGDITSADVVNEIKKLRSALLKILGSNHPEMIKLDMIKRRRDILG